MSSFKKYIPNDSIQESSITDFLKKGANRFKKKLEKDNEKYKNNYKEKLASIKKEYNSLKKRWIRAGKGSDSPKIAKLKELHAQYLVVKNKLEQVIEQENDFKIKKLGKKVPKIDSDVFDVASEFSGYDKSDKSSIQKAVRDKHKEASKYAIRFFKSHSTKEGGGLQSAPHFSDKDSKVPDGTVVRGVAVIGADTVTDWNDESGDAVLFSLIRREGDEESKPKLSVEFGNLVIAEAKNVLMSRVTAQKLAKDIIRKYIKVMSQDPNSEKISLGDFDSSVMYSNSLSSMNKEKIAQANKDIASQIADEAQQEEKAKESESEFEEAANDEKTSANASSMAKDLISKFKDFAEEFGIDPNDQDGMPDDVNQQFTKWLEQKIGDVAKSTIDGAKNLLNKNSEDGDFEPEDLPEIELEQEKEGENENWEDVEEIFLDSDEEKDEDYAEEIYLDDDDQPEEELEETSKEDDIFDADELSQKLGEIMNGMPVADIDNEIDEPQEKAGNDKNETKAGSLHEVIGKYMPGAIDENNTLELFIDTYIAVDMDGFDPFEDGNAFKTNYSDELMDNSEFREEAGNLINSDQAIKQIYLERMKELYDQYSAEDSKEEKEEKFDYSPERKNVDLDDEEPQDDEDDDYKYGDPIDLDDEEPQDDEDIPGMANLDDLLNDSRKRSKIIREYHSHIGGDYPGDISKEKKKRDMSMLKNPEDRERFIANVLKGKKKKDE